MPRISPDTIIAEARRWVGTPYRHRAARLGIGVDCVGLIRGVAEATGVRTLSDAEWKPFETYSRTPNPEKMRQAMELFLEPSDVSAKIIAPDAFVCWLAWREHLPMHVGFAAALDGRRTLIHAALPIGQCVEHGFTDEWLSRVNSWWRLPGVDY